MFDRFLNNQPIDKLLISPEEIALFPHRKEASNFIALTHQQKLNVLEGLLLERVANAEDAEEIMQAITLLQPPTKPAPSDRNVHYSFGIPVLSEVADILKMGTVATLLTGVVMGFSRRTRKIGHVVNKYCRACFIDLLRGVPVVASIYFPGSAARGSAVFLYRVLYKNK